MFERYDEAVRRAIFGAYTEAQSQGTASIETEHLLLGVLQADPQIVERLTGSEMSPESLRFGMVLDSMEHGPVAASPNLPLSNQCKRVLAYANEEAERLGARHILTGHLLIGFLREEGCRAAELLKQQGADLTAMRNRMAAEARESKMRHPASPSPEGQANETLASDLRPAGPATHFDSRPESVFESCNERARRAVFFARFEASHWGHGVIEPEHLLLGILREGLGIVYALLGQQTPWNDLIPKLREKLGPADPKQGTSVDMPLSKAAKRVLAGAVEECDRHGGGHVAIAHLLLALVEDQSSYASTLLRERGADAEKIRREIAKFRL